MYDQQQLLGELDKRRLTYIEIQIAVSTFAYSKSKSEEIGRHGIGRRLRLLNHLAHRIFETIPLDEGSPNEEALLDATAFLQAFTINIFGLLDNLAWLWVVEANIRKLDGKPLPKGKIGLHPVEKYELVRASFPQGVVAHLNKAAGWFEYLEDYRHSLAHRIPFYIPPKQLNKTQSEEYKQLNDKFASLLASGDIVNAYACFAGHSAIGSFQPVIMHSYFEEAKPVLFHGQVICDLWTVHDLTIQIFAALKERM
jgi:hypothetical protein